MMTITLRFVVPCLAVVLLVGFGGSSRTIAQEGRGAAAAQELDQGADQKNGMKIHYLEIVTPKVDATCNVLEKTHGVSFGRPIAEFGNARMTKLAGGGRIGVRAPMRATEEPVVRPYVLVEDIEAAVKAAKAAGGEVAMPATEISGHGRFAIYILGGNQFGVWQP